MTLLTKLVLAAEFWWTLAGVLVWLRRLPLPELVQHLNKVSRVRRRHDDPVRLGQLAAAALRLPGWQARCLLRCLVAYRVIRRQGGEPVLQIGIRPDAVDHETHSWLELDGRDVGPPPGKGNHEVLVTYC